MAQSSSTGIKDFVKHALTSYYKNFQIKLADGPESTDVNPAIKINNGKIYVHNVGNYNGNINDSSTLLEVINSMGNNVNVINSEIVDINERIASIPGASKMIAGNNNLTVLVGEDGSTYFYVEGYRYNKDTSSFAIGKDTSADGISSFAGGYIDGSHGFINALGTGSFAYGYAKGMRMKSIGIIGQRGDFGDSSIYAIGYGAHAEGYANPIYGDNIPAEIEFYAISASGYGAHAEGAIGGLNLNNLILTPSGIGSQISINGSIEASGYGAHAEGIGTLALNHGAHSEGVKTHATAAGSHTEGYSSTASGTLSHAEGYATDASGRVSHAEGIKSIAGGIASHAEGGYFRKTSSRVIDYSGGEANGDGSHAEGIFTITNNFGEHAEGVGNISHKTSNTYGHAGNTLHSIGIGTASAALSDINVTRKNAFEVMQDGSVYLIGVGLYDGSNYLDASTLQEVINSKGGGGSETDTKDTAGTTTVSATKMFLVGATTTGGTPVTHVNEKVYIGTDNCLYSNNTIVSINGHTHSEYASSSHDHGNLTNTGKLTNNPITISTASSLPIVLGANAGDNAYSLCNSTIQFDTTINDLYLCKNGTWQTVSGGSGGTDEKLSVTSTTSKVYLAGMSSTSTISTGYTNTNVYMQNGNVTAVAFYQSSDARKKNVKCELDIEKCYELIDKCSEIVFEWKDKENSKEEIGMIALEVQEFFPEIINEDEDGYLSLDYSKLTVICLRVLKDLINEVKILKNLK